MKVIRKFNEVGQFILTTTEGDICIRTALDFAMKLQVGDVISFAGFDLYGEDNDDIILSSWISAIVNYKGVDINSDELVVLLSRDTFKIVERNLSNDGFALYVELDSYADKAFSDYLLNFYAVPIRKQ